MTKKTDVHLILYSLSASLESIRNVAQMIKDDGITIVFLSPHVAFDFEKKQIQNILRQKALFTSFYEFISQSEMEFCDSEADKTIMKQYGTRHEKLHIYYDTIKRIKNESILKNILYKYNIFNKYILSSDLGIDEFVWVNNGFITAYGDISTRSENSVPTINARLVSYIKKFFTLTPVIILQTNDTHNYFWGHYARVKQYVDGTKCTAKNLPLLEYLFFHAVYKLSGVCKQKPLLYFYIALLHLFRIVKKSDIPAFLTTIHEYSGTVSYLAALLKTNMICMQDGYLPGYYTSAYLKYYIGVQKFYIWDSPSCDIFKRHELHCEVWPYYKRIHLPLIHEEPIIVRQVVFLASGAGDWTALKNRSDEDLAFLAFVGAAKEYPQIKFVYRPHPLWVHPQHQGLNSIQRLIDFKNRSCLENLIISAGALSEGNEFWKDGNVSKKSKSIDEEVTSSDIVFGDHSQALIEAAKSGKIIASVSLARRMEFFSSFTKLGFPILRSSEDISFFIHNLKYSDFISKYNEAINRYNSLEVDATGQ
jgi:hypothetical protein